MVGTKIVVSTKVW